MIHKASRCILPDQELLIQLSFLQPKQTNEQNNKGYQKIFIVLDMHINKVDINKGSLLCLRPSDLIKP